MKHSILIASLVGIGSARYVPLPASNDLGTAPKDASACYDLPIGTAPLPGLDTPKAFADFSVYSYIADTSLNPSNYTKSFGDYNSSVSSPSYLGLFMLDDYRPELCAAHCNDRADCVAFNIFIQRDPSKDPGPDCPNPPATANVKCTLFSSSISPEQATNAGQLRPPADALGKEFKVLVRGSNGYNIARKQYQAAVVHVEGYNGPWPLAGAVNTSVADIADHHLGTIVIEEPLNAKRCAEVCESYEEFHWKPCNYFNMYQLAIEDASNRFFCSLFDKPVPSYVADDIMFMQDKNGNSYKVLSSSAFVRAVEMDPLPSTDPIHRPQGLHKRARITTVVTTKLPPKAAKSTSVVGLQGWPYVVTAGGSRLGYVVTPGSPAALGLSNPPVTTKKTKKTTTVFVHPKTAYQVATTTVNHVSTQYVNQPIPTTVFQPVPTTVVEVELQPTTVTDRGTTAVTKVSDIVLVETVIHTITKATPTSEPSTIYVLSPTTTTVYKTKDCENKTKTKTVRDIITKTVTEVQVVQTEVVVPTTATVTTGPRVTTVLTSRIVWRTKTDGGDE